MSTAGVVLAAGAAGLAAYLLSGTGRLMAPPARLAGEDRDDRSALLRFRPALALLAFMGGWSFLGGAAGVVAGCAGFLGAWWVLGRAESPAARRRRDRLSRDLPVAVDLIGACLAAGRAPESALLVVAEAVGGPVAEELLLVHSRLSLGVDPGSVWREVARDPQLGALGRAVSRANETGGSIADAVHRLGDELRARARADVEERARSVEVKAAAPLGVCLLPAFVLLGVVPLVVGIFGSMDLFR